MRVWYSGKGVTSKVITVYSNVAQFTVETNAAYAIAQTGFGTAHVTAPRYDGEILIYRVDNDTNGYPIALTPNCDGFVFGFGRNDNADDTYDYEMEFIGAEILFMPADQEKSTSGLASYLMRA
jgi:hypothetical protein